MSFHARDDYFHVLKPALAWLEDPLFDWDHSGWLGTGLRSHLFPRCVWLLFKVWHALGLETPESQLSATAMVLGLYNLTLVPGLYAAAWTFYRCRATACTAAWLAAIFFPLPYVGTHLLIEALAMPCLLWALVLAESQEEGRLWWAGCLFGLAFWWRFQVLTAMCGWFVWRCYEIWRHRKAMYLCLPIGLGFLAIVSCEGYFDAWTTGSFLGPLWRNLVFNWYPPAHLSRSSVFGYVGLWFFLTLPPATIFLFRGLSQAAIKAPAIACSLLSFVVAHALIPHKEDRFMIPVLPLYTLFLAFALTQERTKLRQREYWQVFLYRYAWGFLGLGLFLAVGSQSQANLRDTMRFLRDDRFAEGVISLGPEMQTYFLGKRLLTIRETNQLDHDWLHQQILQLKEKHINPNRFVVYHNDEKLLNIFLQLEGYVCEQPVSVSGYWLDRLLYAVNPRRNRRRAPISIYACRPFSDEVAMKNHPLNGSWNLDNVQNKIILAIRSAKILDVAWTTSD